MFRHEDDGIPDGVIGIAPWTQEGSTKSSDLRFFLQQVRQDVYQCQRDGHQNQNKAGTECRYLDCKSWI